MRENADQDNSEYGHFSRSVITNLYAKEWLIINMTNCIFSRGNYYQCDIE